MNSLVRTLLLFLLATFANAAEGPWPGVKFTEVRAYQKVFNSGFSWRDFNKRFKIP